MLFQLYYSIRRYELRPIMKKLILVTIFPFVHVRPWKLQGPQLIVKCERVLQEMWEKEDGLVGDYLCKLLISARSL